MNNKPPKITLREAAEMAVNVLEGLGYDPVDLRNALSESVDAKAIRAEALEEAAKVCEQGTALTYFQNTDCYNYAHNRAKAIRSLK